MQFVHYREHMSGGDAAIVNCSHQCNVRLMDDNNFRLFKSGRRHEYYGGFYERLPARISVPCTGYWNVVIDLGGGSASIRHSLQVVRAA